MKCTSRNSHRVLSILLIGTMIPIALQGILYLALPFMRAMTFRDPSDQIIYNTVAFLLINIITTGIALYKNKLALLIYQPVYFLLLALIFHLATFAQDYIDGIGVLFFLLFFEGWAILFLCFSLSTIPSGILLYRLRVLELKPSEDE